MTKKPVAPLPSIADLITKAGVDNIVVMVKRKNRQRHFTRGAVYKWTERGIPDRHWDVVMELTGVPLSRIYAINKKVRVEKSRASRRKLREAVAS